jgi:anthranilate phosphoribosyltransferase
VCEGRVAEWTIEPARYGLGCEDLDGLAGGEPAENARRIERLLEGEDDLRAVRCAVLLNAAAGLYVSGGGWSFQEAVERAIEALESGAAAAALERLRRTARAAASA